MIAGSGHRCGILEGKKSVKEEFCGLMEVGNFVLKTHPFDEVLTGPNMRYEDMISDPIAEIKKLSNAMNVCTDSEMINKQIGNLEEPLSGIDPVTLLHSGHKTDGRPGSYAGTLGQEDVRAIEAEFGGWLMEHGYDPGSWSMAMAAEGL